MGPSCAPGPPSSGTDRSGTPAGIVGALYSVAPDEFVPKNSDVEP